MRLLWGLAVGRWYILLAAGSPLAARPSSPAYIDSPSLQTVEWRVYPYDTLPPPPPTGWQPFGKLTNAWYTPAGRALRGTFTAMPGSGVLAVVSADFFLDTVPTRPLALWLPGVVGQVDVYLNDQLLYRSPPHWGGLQVPLPAVALHTQFNTIRLEFTASAATRPVQVVGLTQPSALLAGLPAAQPQLLFAPAALASPCTHGPLLYVQPHSPAWGWALDSLELADWLAALPTPTVTDGRPTLAFLPPHRPQYHRWARSLGWPTCELPQPFAPTDDSTTQPQAAWLHAPVGHPPAGLPIWLSEDGLPLPGLGHYAPAQTPERATVPRWLTIVILFTLLLILAIWKRLDGRSFDRILLMRGHPGQSPHFNAASALTENQTLPVAVWLLATVVTHLLFTLGLVLAVPYVQSHLCGYFRESSLMATLCALETPRGQLYATLFVQFLLLFRLLVSALLMRVYRWRGFLYRTLEMDIYAYYPFHLLLLVLALTAMVGLGSLDKVPLWIMVSSLVGLLGFRCVYQFQFIVRTWGLPQLGALLYICTLDLLPWLILV